MKTGDGKFLKFLVDTGANKNYICKRHVKFQNCRVTTPTRVRNISGSFVVDRFVEFNPFIQIPGTSKLTFFVFDFHPFFDGLIGYESLQKLKANILTTTNVLQFPNGAVKMLRKYPETTALHLNAHETKIINIATSVQKGDFFLEDDIFIAPYVAIQSGLYTANEKHALVAITNMSAEPTRVNIPGEIQTEICNFETNKPLVNKPIKRDLFKQLRTDHLNNEEKTNLLKVIAEHQDVFFIEGENLTFTNAIKHKIITTDETPVHKKSYRYPFCHREEVQRQVLKMLEQGIIRHSSSPWTSPIWIVPKKADASGKKKWRLVVDYRKLNEKTIDDRYPIPNISDILDKLGRCMYFTTLDLASGFHQIEISEEDVAKTAFSVENGHYEFLRMPFGLKNAPSTFQRVMDNVLREHIGIRCLVYMDDIIIFSTSLKEHLENLSKILTTLEKYNMKIQLDKSEFLKKEVAFLGHIVTPEGVKPNMDKIEAIKKWPLPKTEKELRGFLGILGYYRKFIRDFAMIAKPLTKALRKGEAINHSKEFVDSFERCRNILTGSDILQYPDFEKPFILTTDASNYAVGAVLSQGQIGSDKPIAFASRTLNKSEENYSAIEKELLAIVWACKYFRPYLYGRKFTLYTDHKPLTFSLNLKDSNSRLIHWRLYLEEFDYEIKYRPGKQNIVADSLSRIQTEVNTNLQNDSSSTDDATMHSADTDDSEFIKCTEFPLNKFSNQIILKFGDTESMDYEEVFPRIYRRTITREDFSDSFIMTMFKEFMDSKRSNCIFCPENLMNPIQNIYKQYFNRYKSFKIYFSQKLLLDLKTPEDQNTIIEQTHSSAHRGIWENNRKISDKYFFPKMKHKIREFVKLCSICNKNKYDRHPYKIKLGHTPDVKKPFEILHIDIFISQPDKFLSAVDKFSKFGILLPIKSRTINDIRKGLTKLFSLYGTPNLIVCDNEPALKSIEIRGLLQSLNIEVHYTPPNHSESNGTVERFHSTVAEIFRCIQTDYQDLSKKEKFRIACTLYNNTIHSATKLKPREIFYGIKDGVERSLDISKMLEDRNKFYDEVILQLEKTKNRDLAYHNKKRQFPPAVEKDQVVFNRVQGIKKKTKEQFLPVTAIENKDRIVIESSGRQIHKENIKRL